MQKKLFIFLCFCLSIFIILAVFVVSCGFSSDTGKLPQKPDSENILIIYSSHKEHILAPVIQEFQEETGILVDVHTSGTNELLSQVAAEAANPQADIFFGGGMESLSIYQDYFQPYLSQENENIHQFLKAENNYWTGFSILPTVIIYNKKLINEADLSGFESLLQPRFKGEIAFADPSISGSSYTALITILQTQPQPWEKTLEQLNLNFNHQLLNESGLVPAAVGRGEFQIGVTYEENALQNMKKFPDLAIFYPPQGTTVLPDGVAIIKQAKHMEHAKKFVDFVVSYPVQKSLQDTFKRRSIRNDLPLSDAMLSFDEINIIPYDFEFAIKYHDDIINSFHRQNGAADEK